jgi:hypothetical protein
MKGVKNHWETYKERLGEAQKHFGGQQRAPKRTSRMMGVPNRSPRDIKRLKMLMF